MYEVELKFALADPDAMVAELSGRGARRGRTVEQRDVYFSHPQRDFGRTDEALRVRTIDGDGYVTYKGPVVDSQTKTRREIEIGLSGQDAGARLGQMLELLGFRPVREVRKQRQPFHLEWQDCEFEIAIDQVAGLGTFVEVETLADEAARPAALEAILSLVAQLRLPPPERKSYLCLLLEKDRQNH